MANSDCVINFSKGQSKFAGSSPTRVLNYLERHNERGFCYGLDGQPLAGSDRASLVEYAESTGFRRLGTLSLRWGNELSDRDYRRSARAFFSEFTRDRPTLRVAWSIHRNTEHHHVQFALIGSKEDCWTSQRDLSRLRELGRELFISEQDRVFELAPDYERIIRKHEYENGWFYSYERN